MSDFIISRVTGSPENLRNISFKYQFLFMLLFMLGIQSVFAQVTNPTSPEGDSSNQYTLDCVARYQNSSEIFYSTSPDVLYQSTWNPNNVYLRVHELINTDDGNQFLKGHFYEANKTDDSIGLPIPKDRVDEYRKKDGSRSTWFVPSNQWLCSFGFETQLWLDQVREERGNE